MPTARRAIVAAAVLVGVWPAVVGAAPEKQPPRLEGAWSVTLVFRVAEGLADREVGQRVRETWVFRPRCAKGTCAVELRRAGRTLLLRPSGAGYSGKGVFRGAFFCNGETYPKGTRYVEAWTVRVTRSAPGPKGRRALAITGVGATVGRSSSELPCAVVVSREGVELAGVPRTP